MTHIDHDELAYLLSKIGKEVFVEILYPAIIRNDDVTVIELARKYPRFASYTPTAQNTRLSKAKKIFNNEWQREALESIAASERIALETRQEARRLLSL